MIRVERSIRKKFAHKNALLAPVRDRTSLSEIFHENTKLGRLKAHEYLASIQTFLRSASVRDLMTRAYKTYSLMDRAELPAVTADNTLEHSIQDRRSARAYTGESVSRAELARLLHFAYGKTDPSSYLRAVASGGALYPLELYVLAFRIADLEPGIYHYDVNRHGLDIVELGDLLPMAKDRLYAEGMGLDEAAMVVVVTSIFRRSTSKYLDRGYRMILMEAGAVVHALSLVATSLGLGVCQVGGFLDDELSASLGIDGVEEAPLIPIVLGRIAKAGN